MPSGIPFQEFKIATEFFSSFAICRPKVASISKYKSSNLALTKLLQVELIRALCRRIEFPLCTRTNNEARIQSPLQLLLFYRNINQGEVANSILRRIIADRQQ